MDKILAFLNKFGTLILILLGLLILVSTCNSCGAIEKTNKKIVAVEKVIIKQDSIISGMPSNTKLDILLKINALEISKEIVFTNNSIVRTTVRPDDVMNNYDKQIKELQEKLKHVQ